MKTRWVALALLGLSAAGTLRFPRLMLSPGELGRGHGEIRDACWRCHTPFLGTSDAKCMDCHETTGQGTGLGFHQWSMEAACSKCHTDHLGRAARLTTWEFAHQAAFRFDRDHGPRCADCHPDGRFDRYTCYGCHKHSRRKVEKEHREHGIRDFQQCTQCHRSGDEHEAKRSWRSLRRGR